MRRNTAMSRLKALSLEQKMLAITAMGTLIACFMPWYGINSRVINEWWNAFGSIGSVAGYILLAFSLITLTGILAPVAKPGLNLLKKLPVNESSLYIFLNAQSFFVSLLFIPVYSQYALINATNSGTRFGIYLALVSSLAGTISALSYQRRLERQSFSTQEFVSMPRKQHAINDWEDPETLISEDSEENFSQEEIFDQKYEKEQPEYAGVESSEERYEEGAASPDSQDRIFQ